jgi:hypothetical protein
MPSKKPAITVRVDEAKKARWDAIAEERGVSLTSLIEQAMDLLTLQTSKVATPDLLTGVEASEVLHNPLVHIDGVRVFWNSCIWLKVPSANGTQTKLKRQVEVPSELLARYKPHDGLDRLHHAALVYQQFSALSGYDLLPDTGKGRDFSKQELAYQAYRREDQEYYNGLLVEVQAYLDTLQAPEVPLEQPLEAQVLVLDRTAFHARYSLNSGLYGQICSHCTDGSSWVAPDGSEWTLEGKGKSASWTQGVRTPVLT